MTPPPDTEEQKAHMRVLNARAESLFAALLQVLGADPILYDWRYAREDLAYGEFTLALEEIAGAYIRFNRIPPAGTMSLIRELADLMQLDPESPIRSLLASERQS